MMPCSPLVFLCLFFCGHALEGHGWSYGDYRGAGWVNDIPGTDHGVSWAKGNTFGIHGKERMYLMQNWQAPDWWSSKYVLFNLLGKTLSFTADLSKVPCGVAACLYLVAGWKPGPSSNYCDIQPEFGSCYELDIMEANSVAYQASLHVQGGKAFDGACNENGCNNNIGRYPFMRSGQKTTDLYGPGAYIDTATPFQVSASVSVDGYMRVVLSQTGRELEVYNRSLAGNTPGVPDSNAWKLETYPKPSGVPEVAANKTVQAMKEGLRLVASTWTTPDTHWLDQTGCGSRPHGDLAGAILIISDFSVRPTPTPASTTTSPPSPSPPSDSVVSDAAGANSTDPPTGLPSHAADATMAPPSVGPSAGDAAPTANHTPESEPGQASNASHTPKPSQAPKTNHTTAQTTDRPTRTTTSTTPETTTGALSEKSHCTAESQDPFASGVKVPCCSELQQCLAPWVNNRWFYKCLKSCQPPQKVEISQGRGDVSASTMWIQRGGGTGFNRGSLFVLVMIVPLGCVAAGRAAVSQRLHRARQTSWIRRTGPSSEREHYESLVQAAATAQNPSTGRSLA